jgi:hypothetical protein
MSSDDGSQRRLKFGRQRLTVVRQGTRYASAEGPHSGSRPQRATRRATGDA